MLTRLRGMDSAASTPSTPSAAPDIKPRSRDVTDGMERTAARGMLRAVGMGDEDFGKPQIGIASSWNEITPCNLSLDRLAQASKDGVHAAGGYPLEFGTVSVSDGISMGHEGMHFSLVSREVIADSVETVMMAERLDGSVLLAGCDKSLPGMLMAAARLDLASVFVYAGSIMPGVARLTDGTERQVTIIDAFEAVGADVLYAPGVYDAKTIRTVTASLGKPFNLVMGFADPTLTVDQIAAAGVKRISTGGAMERHALNAFLRSAREMKDKGSFSYVRDMAPVKEVRAAFNGSVPAP